MVVRPWTKTDDKQTDEMLSRMPPYLYRYTHLDGNRREYARQVVVDSTLYFTASNAFNDPLDCRVPLSYKASELKIKHYWREYIKDTQPPNTRISSKKKQINAMFKDSLTPAGQKRLSTGVFDFMDRHGILCLSSVRDDMLMWSYYANGHRGICFRLRTDGELLLHFQRKYFLWKCSILTSSPM